MSASDAAPVSPRWQALLDRPRWTGRAAAPWAPLRPFWRLLHGAPGRLFIVSLFALTATGAYVASNAFNAARDTRLVDPEIGLDRLIPAIEWSILAYLSFYAYHVLPALLPRRGTRGDSEAWLVYQGLWLVSAIAIAIFLLLPTDVDLRDQLSAEVQAGTGWPGTLFALLYGVDTPWNAWPSLHLAQSLVVVLVVHTVWWRDRPALRAGLWVAWSLLVVSVVTTKQHFLWDVVTGAALGGGVWWWYLRPRLAGLAPSGWPPQGA